MRPRWRARLRALSLALSAAAASLALAGCTRPPPLSGGSSERALQPSPSAVQAEGQPAPSAPAVAAAAPVKAAASTASSGPKPSAVAPAAVASSASAAAPSDNASSCGPLKAELPELFSVDPSLDAIPVPRISDASEVAMASFYEKLARLLRGRSRDHLRIGVYGDSNLTRDQFTGWLRRSLQAKYGDAGHGFVAAARPWEWYLHTDVVHGFDPRAWLSFASSTHPAPDRLYGFAGISALSQQRGAVSYVQTAGPEAPVGRSVSRLDIYYYKGPRYGSFLVRVDGVVKATIDTKAQVGAPAYYQLEVPDGPHRVEVVTLDQYKAVRLFGTVMERSEPGIVIDALGVGGASCPSFIKQDAATMVDNLRRRAYDLVIFAFGSNYSDTTHLPACMKTLIDRHREALPGLPVILFGPPDYADPNKPPTLSSPLTVKRNAILEKVARDNAAAFWDYRAAMGGELSILRFRSHGMAWIDNVHLTDKGMRFMANRFAYALFKEFGEHLAARPRAGCSGE
jgi:lysophospholipase L1-like esterase